jgi:hypothetical protein
MKALSKDPTGRHQSARDMLKLLEEYVADSGLVASPMRFGEWLTTHFGAEILEQRRAREKAAQALAEFSEPSNPPPSVPKEAAPVYPHVEPAPPSLVAVVQSMREPTPSAREPDTGKRTNVAVWIAVAVVAVAIVVQLLSR